VFFLLINVSHQYTPQIVVTAVRDTVRKMTSPPSPEAITVEDSGPVHRIPAPSDRLSVISERHVIPTIPSESHRSNYREGAGSVSTNGHQGGSESDPPIRMYLGASQDESSNLSLSPGPGRSELGNGHSGRSEGRRSREEYRRREYASPPDDYAHHEGGRRYYGEETVDQWRDNAMGPAYRAGLDQ
jgi:hypothetical protein